MFTINNTKGVSNVISTILMVALTVILAASVGTYVLDLSDQLLQETGNASVELDSSYDSFTGKYIVEGVLISTQNVESIELTASGLTDPENSCSDVSDVDAQPQISEVGESGVICVEEGNSPVRVVSNIDGGNRIVTQSYSFGDS